MMYKSNVFGCERSARMMRGQQSWFSRPVKAVPALPERLRRARECSNSESRYESLSSIVFAATQETSCRTFLARRVLTPESLLIS